MRQFTHPGSCRRAYPGAFDARSDITGVIRLACSASRLQIREKSANLQADAVPTASAGLVLRQRPAERYATRKLARRVGEMSYRPHVAIRSAGWRPDIAPVANSGVLKDS